MAQYIQAMQLFMKMQNFWDRTIFPNIHSEPEQFFPKNIFHQNKISVTDHHCGLHVVCSIVLCHFMVGYIYTI